MLSHIKVVGVGVSQSGKSQLISRLAGQSFKEEYKPTIGVNFYGIDNDEEPKEKPKEKPKEELKEKPKEEPKEESKEEPKEEPKEKPKEEPKEELKEEPKEKTKLHFRDISGQERFYFVADSYLKDLGAGDCIMLTFDCTGNKEAQVKYLQKRMEIAKNSKASCILVVTKCDLSPDKARLQETVEEIRKSLKIEKNDIIYSSAKTDENIDKIVPHLVFKTKAALVIDQITEQVVEGILKIELERLNQAYPADKTPRGDKGRIGYLEKAISELDANFKKIKNDPSKYDVSDPQKAKALQLLLEQPISSYLKNLDKHRGWGEKLARATLNGILIVLSPLALAKKKYQEKNPERFHSAHSYFFRLKGKTYDEGKEALDTIKNIHKSTVKPKK